MNNSFLQAIATMAAFNTAPYKQPSSRNYTKQQTNPDGIALRVFKDGRVYPSMSLVDQFNLEYLPNQLTIDSQEKSVNGLDIFLAHDLPNFDHGLPNSLLIAPVAKNEPKVDLFKTTEYNEDGTPKASVLTQAPTSFGKSSLIPMLEIVLGKEYSEIFAEQKYVDLIVEIDYQLPIAGDFLYIPKTITRGPNKGEVVLIRRGATKVYPLTVKDASILTLTEQSGTLQDEELEEASTTAPEELALHTV